MKKILIISSQYPNANNPVRGIYVKEQVLELSKKFDVNVFAVQNTGTDSISQYSDENINITYIQYSFRKFVFSSLHYFKAVKKTLNDALNAYNPDVIHIHDYQHIPDVFVLSYLLRNHLNKTVVTFHNSRQLFDSHLYMRFFYKGTLKFVLKKYNKIIVVSNKLKNLILPYTMKDNIKVIGNGISNTIICDKKYISQYISRINKNKFKIISVGNLTPSKGFDLLIKAVAKLIQQDYEIELHIFGDGREKNKLFKLIEVQKLTDSVIMHGRVENKIIRNLYSYFDAFVLPSWSETFGIVYLEAMYCKIPVIGVVGEGIDGVIIHKENGLLSRAKDLNDLIDNIKLLINDEVSNNSIIKEAYDLIKKKFLMSEIVKLIVDYYNE